jgi:hypothetical protein
MADVLFVALIVGFFALAVLVVKACERVIGPDVELTAAEAGDTAADRPDRQELVA